MVRPVHVVILSAALLAPTVLAQPTFRAGVDLVTVPVTVTATDGSQVGDLRPSDFRLFEDGVLQQVDAVTREPRPLSICVLLDSSPSMAGREAIATRAIDTLLKQLKPDDEWSMLMFSWKVRVAQPWSKVSDIRTFSWLGWRLSLGTSLIDALKEALALSETAHHPLPVAVIVSDGAEMSSGTTLARLATTRRQSETAVYAIQMVRPPSKYAPMVTMPFAVDVLPELVGDSGGRVYRAENLQQAQVAASAFVDDLRSQYTIGYAPKRALNGTYRRLRIESVSGFKVLHRQGYLATAR